MELFTLIFLSQGIRHSISREAWMGGEGGGVGVYSVILVTEMCKDLLWLTQIFLIIFFGGGGGEVTTSESQGSHFYVKQSYHLFIYLFIYLFVSMGLYEGYVLGSWTFFCQGLAQHEFFGSNNFTSFAHRCHQYNRVTPLHTHTLTHLVPSVA